MMRRYAIPFGCIVFIILLPSFSHGSDLNGLQPPAPYGVFSTMSTESPQKGHIAAGLAYDTILNSNFYRYGTNIAYGIIDNVELSLSVSDQRTGFEDVALGLKHRFLDRGPQDTSLAYVITASLDTGNRNTSTGGRYGGGVILSERVGPLYGHLNLFYTVPGDSTYKGEFRASTGVVFSAAHNIWLLGELYVRSSHYSKDIDQFETKLGYRARVTEDVYADLGFGIDFMQDPTTYRFMVSLSYQYPPQKKTIKRIYEGK